MSLYNVTHWTLNLYNFVLELNQREKLYNLCNYAIYIVLAGTRNEWQFISTCFKYLFPLASNTV
jgi:hypothetical protein